MPCTRRRCSAGSRRRSRSARGDVVALGPVLGQAAADDCEDVRAEVGAFDPGQDQEPGVVDHEGEVLLAQLRRLHDEARVCTPTRRGWSPRILVRSRPSNLARSPAGSPRNPLPDVSINLSNLVLGRCVNAAGLNVLHTVQCRLPAGRRTLRVCERVPLGASWPHLYQARLPFPISGFTRCHCRPLSVVFFSAIRGRHPLRPSQHSTATNRWPVGRGIIRTPRGGHPLPRVILAATFAGLSGPRSLVSLAPINHRQSPAQVPLSA